MARPYKSEPPCPTDTSSSDCDRSLHLRLLCLTVSCVQFNRAALPFSVGSPTLRHQSVDRLPMAIPVARVHLAMAHADLPGLLPSPPKCVMLPLLPAPPGAAIILPSSPPRPSRADAVDRWDAHKTKQSGGSPAPSRAGNPGRASSCEKWVSNKKKTAGAGAATPSSPSSSSSDGRADSDERWDANKKPASTASSSSPSSSSSASRNKGRGGSSKRRGTSRASSSSAATESWDAHKNGRRTAAPAGELEDGESSTASNDVELDKEAHRTPPPPALRWAFYAGPGFIASPEPSMLPMPSFMIRVA
ncbi:unnamed protein product [Urochloa humidicola]